LLHLKVLAPGRDLVADAVARGVHFGEDDPRQIEDHRDPQRLQQHRQHARQIDPERGLDRRRAVGAGHSEVLHLHRIDRRCGRHDHDKDGREEAEAHLLRKADPEHQDEHRQEDRFRNAEGEEQQGFRHVRKVAVLGDQEADQRTKGNGERERGHDLGGGDHEVLADARALQEVTEGRQRVGRGRQQPRIDDAGSRQDFPYREQRHYNRDPRRLYADTLHRCALRAWSEPD